MLRRDFTEIICGIRVGDELGTVCAGWKYRSFLFGVAEGQWKNEGSL